MSVTFSYADHRPALKNKKGIRQFVKTIFNLEQVPLDALTYVFCSDEYLLEINRKFLRHDFYTDIITFDLRTNKKEPVMGEVYLSGERVKENALSHAVPFSEEMLRVIFHGVLHLCGYNDKKKSEITRMRQKEEHYLRLYHESIKSST